DLRGRAPVVREACDGPQPAPPQARHWRLSSDPARHDTDRETRRLARPGVEGPFSIWHRLWLERRGDGRPWHRLRDAHIEDARADRGNEGNLDQGNAGIPRRD